MQRMAMCIGLNPAAVEEYKRLHRAVWPDVLARISASGIRNYSIYLKQPENILFGTWEYDGSDFQSDAAAMAADPATQRWWALCMPMQVPFEPARRANGGPCWRRSSITTEARERRLPLPVDDIIVPPRCRRGRSQREMGAVRRERSGA